MSITSLESIKVGGLCSSKQSATCQIPAPVCAVDGGEKNVRDHIRPRNEKVTRRKDSRMQGVPYLVQ